MKVICSKCSVVNKVADDKMRSHVARCGMCKEALEPDAPGYVVKIDQSNFGFQVKESEKPVLLELWRPG